VVFIFGSGLGSEAGVTTAFDESGSLPKLANGTEVWFDGVAAPILFAQARQVTAQVPYAAAASTLTHIEVRYNGKAAGAAAVPVAPAAPALFPVVINQNGSPNSESSPAPRNSVITVYGTGEGLTDGPNIAGAAALAPYPQSLL